MLKLFYRREIITVSSHMTLIKQEKLVIILVILYIRKYLCFTKLFSNFGYPVPETTKKGTAWVIECEHALTHHWLCNLQFDIPSKGFILMDYFMTTRKHVSVEP